MKGGSCGKDNRNQVSILKKKNPEKYGPFNSGLKNSISKCVRLNIGANRLNFKSTHSIGIRRKEIMSSGNNLLN